MFGELLGRSGRNGEAEPLLEEAIEILDAAPALGGDGIVYARSSLATVRANLGRLDAAEALQLEAIELARERWGERHAQVARLLMNLSLFAARAGRAEDAEGFAREAMDIMIEVRGERHPDVLVARNALAIRLLERGEIAAGLAEHERIVADADAILPPGDYHRGVYRLNFGQALLDAKMREPAEPVLREAFSILESTVGPNHEHTRLVATHLGLLLDATGRPAEAAAYRERAAMVPEASH
jgi:tetratricopeptide (TPR) repeat protein